MYGNDVKDIFEKPEGENTYAVLVGIDDGSGDTESLLDELERVAGNFRRYCLCKIGTAP